jgi:hypothetical protein
MVAATSDQKLLLWLLTRSPDDRMNAWIDSQGRVDAPDFFQYNEIVDIVYGLFRWYGNEEKTQGLENVGGLHVEYGAQGDQQGR